MNRRNLPFNALRAFEAAARHSSVTAAARELSVTHSAVSHQLRRLEKDLGVTLFERGNRGLAITPQGEILAPVLIESFDRILAALDELRRVKPRDSIKVTCTPTFAAKWLVPRLGDWYRDPRAARVNLQPGLELLDFGADASIDFAIRCGVPPWEGLRHELLMPINLVPVCSPRYAAENGLLRQPRDALRRELIHADVGDHGLGQEWRDWLVGVGVECPRNLAGLSFHDPALAMQAAADNLGLAIGYRELIDRDLQGGSLVMAHQRAVGHRFSYYLVYPSAHTKNSLLNNFRDWILGQARSAYKDPDAPPAAALETSPG